MAALAENDRLSGPFLADAGQTDFDADFPLIDMPGDPVGQGVQVQRKRGGLTTYFGAEGFSIPVQGEASFTLRLAEPAQAGDAYYIFGDLPQKRGRAHPPGGAVRTPTLEDDAREAAAKAQELRRDLARGVQAAFGEPIPTAEAVQRSADLAAALGADLNGLGQQTQSSLNALEGSKLNLVGDNVVARGAFLANVGLRWNLVPDAAPDGVTDVGAYLLASDEVAPLTLQPGLYKIGSSCSFTRTVTFTEGARIVADAGVQVTFAAGVVAPERQIFNLDGGGAVAGLSRVQVAWFAGDLINTSTNARPSIQRAYDACVAKGAVEWPVGDLYSDGNAIGVFKGQHTRGRGDSASWLVFTGTVMNGLAYLTTADGTVVDLGMRFADPATVATDGVAFSADAGAGQTKFIRCRTNGAWVAAAHKNVNGGGVQSCFFGDSLFMSHHVKNSPNIVDSDTVGSAFTDVYILSTTAGFIVGENLSWFGGTNMLLATIQTGARIRADTYNLAPEVGEILTGDVSGATATVVARIPGHQDGGLIVEDLSEAYQSINCQWAGGVWAARVRSAVNAQGQRPEHCRFVNTYFDHADNGMDFDHCANIILSGCWAAGKAGDGFTYRTCYNIQNDAMAKACWKNGHRITAASDSVKIRGSAAGNNEANAGFAGVYVEAGASGFDIDVRSGDRWGFGGIQDWGVFIEPGASQRYSVRGDLSLNTLGGCNRSLVGRISTNANYTLTPLADPAVNIHDGTLTADRVVTLATTGATAGMVQRLTRTGGGDFLLSYGGLKSLAQNGWAEATFIDGAWVLTGFGNLQSDDAAAIRYSVDGTIRKSLSERQGEAVWALDYVASVAERTAILNGTNTGDQTAAIALAIAAAGSRGKAVQLSGGRWRTSDLYLNYNGADLRGMGYGATIVEVLGSGSAFRTLTGINTWRAADFTLKRVGPVTSSSIGINLANVNSHGRLERIRSVGHYQNFRLGPTDYGTMSDCIAEAATNDGFLQRNTADEGACQWLIRNLLIQMVGGRGFAFEAVAGPPQVIFGEVEGLKVFASTGRGVDIQGLPGTPVQDVRMKNAFIGESGNTCVVLNTFGKLHQIDDCFVELAGRSATGPGLLTPASGVGEGILITENNQDVAISTTRVDSCSYDGIRADGGRHSLTGCTTTNNGLALVNGRRIGVRQYNDARLQISNQRSGNTGGGTSQEYGVYFADGQGSSVLGGDLTGNGLGGLGAATNFDKLLALARGAPVILPDVQARADDTAAKNAGLPINGVYRDASGFLRQRAA